ncbi:bifunctional 5,10-methylenetetrahydrofolate dehydrogenase/5,10-methenyltetrahydrofolate cyclohydrolase [Candidatus Nomurabacteria bacterium]|nr:bifunctional 5,10-methylenetetrahydrofolate dehydrogenase/5,10-methenyltetrahydrofolate cyclohydrolase [Candidatus Nomurabacteria bacterium]
MICLSAFGGNNARQRRVKVFRSIKYMHIIDGRKIRGEILSKVKMEVAELPFKPEFCDVLVGDDPASVQYVQMKSRTAEVTGIHFHKAAFPASITTKELIKEIEILNKIPNMCGIIIQLPLPEHIDKKAVLDAIDPRLDVDCLGSVASDKFYNGYDSQTDLAYPTALACMALLDSLNLNLKGKIIVVLGQGELVGKPVSAMLRYRGLNYLAVSSDTENKEYHLQQADIIISGMGKAKYITGNMIKSGAIIIDAGTSESGSGMVGDVDLESVKNTASYVSPVPGGVGPVTVAMLLNNVLKVAKGRKNF